MLDRAHGKKRRNGGMILVNAAVAQNHYVVAVRVGRVNSREEIVQRGFKRFSVALSNGKGERQQKRKRLRAQARLVERGDFYQVRSSQNRIVDFQNAAVGTLCAKKVAVRSDINRGVSDNFFAQGVDGRICDLREKLLEVRVKARVLVAHASERSVNAHRACRLARGLCHRENHFVKVFVVPAKSAVKLVALFLRANGNFFVGNFKVGKVDKILVKPFAVGMLGGVSFLYFLVAYQALLNCVDEQHSSRHKARLLDYLALRNVKNAHLA